MNTKSLALFAVPFITTLAHAADTDSETMETITVTASPFNEDEYHIAQPATVLFGEELKRKLYPTIGETLARGNVVGTTIILKNSSGQKRITLSSQGRVKVQEG